MFFNSDSHLISMIIINYLYFHKYLYKVSCVSYVKGTLFSTTYSISNCLTTNLDNPFNSYLQRQKLLTVVKHHYVGKYSSIWTIRIYLLCYRVVDFFYILYVYFIAPVTAILGYELFWFKYAEMCRVGPCKEFSVSCIDSKKVYTKRSSYF